MSKSNIGKRTFNGNSTPVSSELGKILINSIDSRKISMKLREIIKGVKEAELISSATVSADYSVTISKETSKQIADLNSKV